MQTCQKEVFGCASAAMKCKNQCRGDDAEQILNCASTSKNVNLVATECRLKNCHDLAFNYCDIKICVESFQLEFMKSKGFKAYYLLLRSLLDIKCKFIMEF